MTLAESTSTSAPSCAASIAGDPVVWTDVCPVERLTPDRGVAAFVDGAAIAVFLLSSGDLYALSNIEPFGGTSVLSRGLVGDVDGVPTVASPLHKQRFDLRTGQCLDVAEASVATYPVQLVDGHVHVAAVPAP